MHPLPFHDTIVALATPPGIGALAVIRVSGTAAVEICTGLFHGKELRLQLSHTVHVGSIREGETILDEVVVTLFRAPRSFTKEDVVEISCHGSEFVVQQIIRALLRQGCRLAQPGEFTKRAFLNGRFDLAQAEAVADLIASDSEASHRAAMQQMRGGFSQQIRQLREQLIWFASLIELELDFGEEDVEFAQRDDLRQLVYRIRTALQALISSFQTGNVIKNGVPTVIAGKPNAGKSTLLNVLLNEERAIVSEIPGTTRDVIEDELIIEGVRFRLIDTAGLRDATDIIEAIGVSRTREKLRQASLILYVFDASATSPEELLAEIRAVQVPETPLLLVANKIDRIATGNPLEKWHSPAELVAISAATQENIELLKAKMLTLAKADRFKTGNVLVTNLRHYEKLRQTDQALQEVVSGLDEGRTGDLLALDLRAALYALGEITGEITTDDLLANIFSKFCIGK